MELIKDYDCVIDYHSGNVNVVAYTLSRKTMQTFRALNAQLSLTDDGTIVPELIVRLNLLNRVLGVQKKDEKIVSIISLIKNGKETEFTENEDGVLYYKDRVCILNDSELKKVNLDEAHSGSFSIYPGSTKMYQDLKGFVLVVWNEKKCFRIRDQVFSVSESEGRASSSFGIITTYKNLGVEMGPNHYGFCGWVTINREEA